MSKGQPGATDTMCQAPAADLTMPLTLRSEGSQELQQVGSQCLRAPGFHSFHSQGAHRGPEAPFQSPAGEQAPSPSVCPAPSSPCFGDTEPFSQREVQAGPRPGWASDYSLPLLEPMSQSDGGCPHLLNTCLAVGHGETS